MKWISGTQFFGFGVPHLELLMSGGLWPQNAPPLVCSKTFSWMLCSRVRFTVALATLPESFTTAKSVRYPHIYGFAIENAEILVCSWSYFTVLLGITNNEDILVWPGVAHANTRSLSNFIQIGKHFNGLKPVLTFNRVPPAMPVNSAAQPDL